MPEARAAAPVEIAFRGHADVRATDTQALEIVAGDAWSARPGAIGYAPQYDPQALLELRGRLTLTLRVGEAEDTFEATASPLFVRGAPLVIRRDPAAARVFAVQSSKAAADLSADLKAALRAPGAQGLLLLRQAATVELPPGSLVLVGMPIGSQGDLSPRALDVLSGVDVIFAEDTRVAHAALGWRGVRTKLESCYAHNEALRTDELARRLRAGERVAFISDAGMPAISDPGARLVRAASDLGAHVTVVPGPSAITTAIAASGISGERFAFLGFPPRKGAERREQLGAVATGAAPSVLFESPRRLLSLMQALRDLAPDREAAVCRDLTKRSEAVFRGTLTDLADALGETPDMRGEYVIVVAGAETLPLAATPTSGAGDLEDFIRRLLDQNCPTAPIVAALQSQGAPRREAYALVQGLRRAQGD
jgi:16S rRNA (cytidine1402-2'-O)-methyltransferase